jgi:hypothetical protein|tara:strand:- start:30258 stop:30782 length:525 start_codon:yes stop_codon:yes gene_type:complete
MAILDKINLDFQVLSAGDPKILVVMDTSVWGAIEDKPSVIDIIVPGSTKTRTYNFVKGKSNVFNSSNLLISPVGQYKELADGIYRITIKGSPDSNCKQRDFLKTDKIRLLIGDLYLEDYFTCQDIQNNKLRILRDVKLSLDVAEIQAANGKVKEAAKGLADVYSRVRDYIKCRE